MSGSVFFRDSILDNIELNLDECIVTRLVAKKQKKTVFAKSWKEKSLSRDVLFFLPFHQNFTLYDCETSFSRKCRYCGRSLYDTIVSRTIAKSLSVSSLPKRVNEELRLLFSFFFLSPGTGRLRVFAPIPVLLRRSPRLSAYLRDWHFLEREIDASRSEKESLSRKVKQTWQYLRTIEKFCKDEQE